MIEYSFRQISGDEILSWYGKIFDILAHNMNQIAPTGNSFEEDFEIWKGYVISSWSSGKSKVVLIFLENDLCGYFQYSLRDNTFVMEEIQFKPQYQGSGLFSMLYRYMTAVIPTDTEYTEAYANKANGKSQAVLKNLGLDIVGENKNGSSYHFRGAYKTIYDRYADETEIFRSSTKG